MVTEEDAAPALAHGVEVGRFLLTVQPVTDVLEEVIG